MYFIYMDNRLLKPKTKGFTLSDKKSDQAASTSASASALEF